MNAHAIKPHLIVFNNFYIHKFYTLLDLGYIPKVFEES